MITVADWLSSREPAPPSALTDRLRAALGTQASRDASEAADVCLAAGERLLSAVLENESASRECAIDLLAADALVTYAFEAASSDPSELAARASRAMTRIASLGVVAPRRA